MKKFILKCLVYVFLILLTLEGLVRLLHLYTEDPPRYIDEYGVEKRVPGSSGYAVTGNRNQNFSEFRINEEGFNSKNEFNPTEEDYEVALIGDSFIEGFHQDYYISTGEKVEEQTKDISVYEYGYAGYDLANQMHLIHAYKDQFELIDKIIIYLNYESDLSRGEYSPNYARIKMLNSTLFKIRDNIKLLAYGSKIGILEPFKRLAQGKAFREPQNGYQENEVTLSQEEIDAQELKRLNNFKSLVSLYGFDKEKTVILLDSRKTADSFLRYCKAENIEVLDFAPNFKASKKSTTLIYDHHWNEHGRDIIAKTIADYLTTER
ncbi:hypothetical protein D1013_03590 [Euzebyella marina]|uniref:SGNH/GDSL hydrolase family protein n=1 Tax=Euzebyella marina TaxID=1761453 RepID=A0A3G2L2P0_9FLAO|nr:hypothetical protein [Euzebyella marina]AYN66529.1 hypothetical protein D1013_03590 [Euzebyella marina]